MRFQTGGTEGADDNQGPSATIMNSVSNNKQIGQHTLEGRWTQGISTLVGIGHFWYFVTLTRKREYRFKWKTLLHHALGLRIALVFVIWQKQVWNENRHPLIKVWNPRPSLTIPLGMVNFFPSRLNSITENLGRNKKQTITPWYFKLILREIVNRDWTTAVSLSFPTTYKRG